METRPNWKIKLHAAQRYLAWQYSIGDHDHVRIAEFPKSGGTWLSQMVAEMMGIPFPRNAPLSNQRCVQHEHFAGPTDKKTVLLVRDGRDVMTSAYFHFIIAEEGKPNGLVNYWRKQLGAEDYTDIQKNMAAFISIFSDHFTAGRKKMSWSSHIESYLNSPKLIIVKYEDLLADAPFQLKRIADFYNYETDQSLLTIADKFSFKQQTNRNPGEENSSHFLRKGIAGDWKNHFDQKAIDTFDKLHGQTLKKLGYD